ncbi:hypothetical protein VCHA53O466_50002 [Vibrio chagasii]|nr:hypothetical protein VCHA53O466_50002 [Vibrio chagasii]
MIAFDHRNRVVISQDQYNSAYTMYVQQLRKTNAGTPEVESGKCLLSIRSPELSVVLHHARLNGAKLNTVCETEVVFSDSYESYICLAQLQQALILYKQWCSTNKSKPEIDRVTSIDELSQNEISHIIHHAKMEGFKLLPLR